MKLRISTISLKKINHRKIVLCIVAIMICICDGGYNLAAETEEKLSLPEYVYAGKRRSGVSIRYVVITHSQGWIVSPQDLLKCKLVTSNQNLMVMAQQWIDSLIFEQVNSRFKNKPKVAENIFNAILQVFFKKSDAAIVTRESFDLACELNPFYLKRRGIM